MDYSFLKNQKIDTPKSVLGGLCVGALAIVLLLLYVKKPITAKITRTNGEISQARKQLKINKSLANQLPGLQKKRDALARDLKRISSKLVSAETPVLWATQIVEAYAAREKITVRTYNPGGVNQLSTTDKRTKKTIENPYEEFRTSASLWGTIHQFGRFLAALETDYPVMRVASFTMRPRSKTPSDGLNIQFDANYLQFSETGFPPEDRPKALGQPHGANESMTE